MTTVRGQLLAMLEAVAVGLGDELRTQMVFVGGCTTALFITDPVTLEDVRATDDVDLIVDLAGRAGWAVLQDVLFQKGFTVSAEDEVICRMRLGDLKVDFMPDDPAILGFSNRWYELGLDTAENHVLREDLEIKLLTPPLFLATKLEAFLGRGNDDPIGSHDLEDVLIVVDGREELVDEVSHADAGVRSFIAAQLQALMEHYDYDSFIDGNVRGPEGRADIVRNRLAALVAQNDAP